MNRFLPWIAYFASVVISRKYADGYWVVGPIFALTCLAANLGFNKKITSLKSGIFVLGSTLIYALVFWISKYGWQFKQDFLDMAVGPLTVGVILGSVLMPFFHGILFGLNERAVRKVPLRLIGSWYAINVIAFADDFLKIPWNIDYLLIAIALWQGIYLRSLKIS